MSAADHPQGPREVVRQVPREYAARDRLADLRLSAVGDVEWGEFPLSVSVGFYDDGRPGEVFAKLKQDKAAMLESMIEKYCICFSRGLQRGVTVAEFMSDVVFGPDGKPETVFDLIILTVRDLVQEVEIRTAPLRGRG